MLGLRFCARAFSSCGERGPLFIAVRGPLTIAASLVAEHRLQTRRLSSCGSHAQLLRGVWDLPRPGLEPVSPALAGGFLTTVPPGKPSGRFLVLCLLSGNNSFFLVIRVQSRIRIQTLISFRLKLLPFHTCFVPGLEVYSGERRQLWKAALPLLSTPFLSSVAVFGPFKDARGKEKR